MERGQDVPLRKTDEAELHSDDLLSKVAANLRESGAGDPTDVAEPEDKPELDVDEDAEEDVSGTDDDDDASGEESEEGDPTSDEDAGEVQDEKKKDESDGSDKDTLVDIPDAYMRSAASYGWTPEAVADMTKDLGHDHMMTVLQNIHQKNNELTNTFSSLGRKAQELDNGPLQVGLEKEPGAYQPVNIEALKEELGEGHELVRVVEQQQKQMGNMKATLDNVNQQLSRTNNQVEKQRLQEVDNQVKVINGFFDDDGLKPYVAFYGSIDGATETWDKLSDQQMHNRDRVCVLADQIRVGAQMHGTGMDLPTAMERAHLVVSEPISASIIRSEILKSVEKRHKSRVVRPSSSKKAEKKVSTEKPTTRKEIVARAEQGLAKLFKE